LVTKYIDSWKDELNICIRCAYCFAGCPIFKELGWEVDGARGKVELAYGLLMGEFEPSQYIADKLFQCTFCKDCIEQCAANVSVPDIVTAIRSDLFEAGYTYPGGEKLLADIKETGNIFGEKLKPPEYTEEKQVLLGCRLLERKEDSTRYLELLKKLGVEPKTFDETCCGMPFAVLGDKKGFAEQQDTFRESLPNKDEELICVCTTCIFFIQKSYPDLKATYVIDVILEKLRNYTGEIKKLGKKVTYHDPCNVARGMDMVDEPREILDMIGVELVEMPTKGKQAECCGGGGGLLATDNPLAEKLAEKRMKQALDIGVDTLVTLCPTCEFNIGNVSKKNGGKLEVKNLLDLIYEAVV